LLNSVSPTVDHHLVRELNNREGARFREARPKCAENAAEPRACSEDLHTRLIRIWLANRGVWEAIVGAGPVCSIPAADEDVDAYLSAWNELLTALI
jgi:hypothetical protein